MKENKDYSIFLFWSAVIITIIILFLSVCKDKVFADDLIGTDLSSLQEYYEYPVTCNQKGHEGYEDLGMRCIEADTWVDGDDFAKKHPFLCISLTANDMEGYVFFTSAECPPNVNYLQYMYAHTSDYEGQPQIHMQSGSYYLDKSNSFVVSWSNEWLNINAKPYSVTTPYKVVYDGNLLEGTGSIGNTMKDFIGRLRKGNFIVKNTEELGSENNPKYSDDIGSLKFTSAEIIYSKEEQGWTVPDWLGNWFKAGFNNFYNGKYYFRFSNSTTGGLSLNSWQDKYAQGFIEYKIQSLCTADGQLPQYKEYSGIYKTRIGSEMTISIGEFMSEFEELSKYIGTNYEEIAPLVNFDFKVFVRPIFTKKSLTVIPDSSSDGEWVCGKWSAVTMRYKKTATGENQDVEEGTFDDNGDFVFDSEYETPSGTHTGDTFDDAMDSAKTPNASISDVVSSMKMLLDEVKIIPSIIGELLSFLPPWVITLIALTISIVCILIILKIARG